nr:HNH endonuclease [Brucella pseudogrignonensis]
MFCLRVGDVEPATVCDHRIPHKGDVSLFWNPDNLQSLCKPCHDGTKQRMELGQTIVTFGADGWPIDCT